MRIAILSDFHIGYERFREDAFRQADEALQLAASSADMMVIPGDIFDFRHPKPEILAEAITLFRSVQQKGLRARVTGFEGRGKAYTDVPIVAIPGTHERRTDGETDPVDLLNLAGLVVNVNQARAIVEKDGEKVAVYGVGGIAEERFMETLRRLDPKPISGAFNLFMFHQSIYELLPFSQDFPHLDELPDGFDLYVDGHVHSRVEAKCHGRDFLVPGSTVLTQLKEGEQGQKGIFIYDTRKGTYTFSRINSRRFFVAKIDVSGLQPAEIGRALDEKIAAMAEGGGMPVVRIILEGKMKEGFRAMDLSTKGIAERFAGRAIVEIARSGLGAGDSDEAQELRRGMLSGVPIRDYGIGVFLERLKENKYGMGVSPSLLFDILSSEEKKEAVIKKALEIVLNASA